MIITVAGVAGYSRRTRSFYGDTILNIAVADVVGYSRKRRVRKGDASLIITVAGVAGNSSRSCGNIFHIDTTMGRINNPTIFYSKMLRCPRDENAVSCRTSNIPVSNNVWVISRSRTTIRHSS